jgi:hypothetical protein
MSAGPLAGRSAGSSVARRSRDPRGALMGSEEAGRSRAPRTGLQPAVVHRAVPGQRPAPGDLHPERRSETVTTRQRACSAAPRTRADAAADRAGIRPRCPWPPRRPPLVECSIKAAPRTSCSAATPELRRRGSDGPIGRQARTWCWSAPLRAWWRRRRAGPPSRPRGAWSSRCAGAHGSRGGVKGARA